MLNFGCLLFGRSCCPYWIKRKNTLRKGKHILVYVYVFWLQEVKPTGRTCSCKAWLSCWQLAVATPHVQCLCWLADGWTWSFGWLGMAEGVQSWSCNGYHGDALSCNKKTEHCKMSQKPLAPLLTKWSQSLPVPKDMYDSSIINIQGSKCAVSEQYSHSQGCTWQLQGNTALINIALYNSIYWNYEEHKHRKDMVKVSKRYCTVTSLKQTK